jgi:hypothetical protein
MRASSEESLKAVDADLNYPSIERPDLAWHRDGPYPNDRFTINMRPLSDRDVMQFVGSSSIKEVERLSNELRNAGVFSETSEGVNTPTGLSVKRPGRWRHDGATTDRTLASSNSWRHQAVNLRLRNRLFVGRRQDTTISGIRDGATGACQRGGGMIRQGDVVYDCRAAEDCALSGGGCACFRKVVAPRPARRPGARVASLPMPTLGDQFPGLAPCDRR